jgi:phage terminase large subunit
MKTRKSTLFTSTTSFEEAKGKAKAAGKRDILFLNECDNIPFPIADALMIRSKETYMDYNPTKEFWAHTEIQDQSNAEFLKLTYLDNEAMPGETLEDMLIKRDKAYHDINGNLKDPANIKNQYWHNWWQVYGLGEIGNLIGVVFDNWSQVDSIPEDAKLLGYGMDFGFTNDPTTLIAIYQSDGLYYLDEVIYQKGLTNSELVNLMNAKGVNKRIMIYADSADPKSIKDISTYGFAIKGADKGKDSIMYGIGLMQDKKFLISKRSHNLIKEFRSYLWDTDRSGQQINIPIDAFNHCIDAVRYYFASINKSTGKYNFG